MDPRLIAHSGPLMGQTLSLTEDEIVIGRDASSHISLADLAVSRHHCRIYRTGDSFRIVDLDSLNGTFLNGLPVKERTLSHGDQIKLGDTCFSFLLEDESQLPSRGAVQWDEEETDLVGRTVELRREDALYLQPEKTIIKLPPNPRIIRNLNTLLALSQVIHSLQDTEKLAHQLLQSIVEVIPAEQGALLWCTNDSEDGFSLISSCGTKDSTATIAVSRTVVRRVQQSKTAILHNHIFQEPALKDAQSLIVSQIRSLMAVPLLLYDKVVGLIYLVTRDPATRFDEDHLQLLTAIAGMAAVGLENARHFEALHFENRRLQDEINLQHNMVGESPRMQEVFQFIARAAPRDSTVLIRGESGTGKELVARAIHQNSLRRDKPFMAINCAALTESLLESELFGYEKGAFTNALTQKKGKLEVADGGTVFLDEVAELAPALEAKLLRVLQEREFDRVGGTRPIAVDVRIVAATNKNLEEALRQGTFRQDLYFRLNVVSLTMPPLRERPQDIPLLASYFIEKYSKKSGRRVTGLSPEVRALLVHYDWPGNVRELENAIEHAVVLGSSQLVLPEDLPEALLEKESATGVPLAKYHEIINETKKQTIIKAFQSAGGSYTETAHLLGLHPNYLHRLIRNLDLKLVLKQKAGGTREGRQS
jgi:transcriptional regulator with GAF, ATPase, and Fis domain